MLLNVFALAASAGLFLSVSAAPTTGTQVHTPFGLISAENVHHVPDGV